MLVMKLSYGVTGNTSAFGAEESRFEPLWDNNKDSEIWIFISRCGKVGIPRALGA